MSTLPMSDLPANPSIPLTPEARTAYEDLYKKIQKGIDSTMDLAVIQPLNMWWKEVDQVLTEDDLYKKTKDTEVFDRLQKQINHTNEGLATLKDQISAIASHFALAGEIMAAIEKVLTIIPGV